MGTSQTIHPSHPLLLNHPEDGQRRPHTLPITFEKYFLSKVPFPGGVVNIFKCPLKLKQRCSTSG